MSTFKCEVVPVVLEPHPNADNLSIVRVWGYTVVVRTDDWKDLDQGVYIPPDSVVPDTERFRFLFTDYGQRGRNPGRITVRRFRGVYSEGLLLPLGQVSQDRRIGEDVSELWGITHYEPPITYTHTPRQGQKDTIQVAGPPGMVPKYDVESYKRYGQITLPQGTPVYITEKIHGCNGRFVYVDKMYCGSRSTWKHDGSAVEGRNTEYVPTDPWWNCFRQNPWIGKWCQANPGKVLYGEVFGQVQDLRYGADSGQLFFLAFDVFDSGRWLPYDELCAAIPAKNRVPVLEVGNFTEAWAYELAERDSVVCPGQLSEGVVICPLVEMMCVEIGRVQLKIVSNRYLERT